MAGDFFLKIDTIKGESKDDKHKDEIDILSYSFGATQTGTFALGGGGGAGRVSMQDFHFQMQVNTAAPKLFLACANGEHFKSAQLTVRKAGKEQKEFYIVKFTDVLVSSYQTSCSGDPVPMEQISLNFSKIEMEYKAQKADGSLEGGIKAWYDVKTNKAG